MTDDEVREQRENFDFTPVEEAVRSFRSVEPICELLPERRLEVMRLIMAEPRDSIDALAERLGRDTEEVRADVQPLAEYHIAYYETVEWTKRLAIPYEEVVFDVSIRASS